MAIEDDKSTDKLVAQISGMCAASNAENDANIPVHLSSSEELTASQVNENNVCQATIEVNTLKTATEENVENIPNLETSIVANGHSSGTQVDKDCEHDIDPQHLESNYTATTDQAPIDVQSSAATIPEIGHVTSILDNVDGKNEKSDSDHLRCDESTQCIQDDSNGTEELAISTSYVNESSDQAVVCDNIGLIESKEILEPIVDVIASPPATEMGLDVVNIQSNGDILEVKNMNTNLNENTITNDTIDSDQETSASSNQNVCTPALTMPVNRSISEATTVSRTISDDLEMKGN